MTLLGTEPIVGRAFRCINDNNQTTGTGLVSILPYFSGRANAAGEQIIQQSGVLTVNQQPSYVAFASNTVSNTGQIVSSGYSMLRDIVLQKTDNILTYVYLYDKSDSAPTSEDTPKFRFIVKNTMPLSLFANQIWYNGISIRATSDLNGTTNPSADTLFVNITSHS